MAIRFMDPKESEDIQSYVNDDPEFRLAAGRMMTNVLLQVGDSRCVIKVREGVVSEIHPNPVFAEACSFYVKGSEDAWAKFLQPVPPPFYNVVFSAMIRQNFELGGDLEEAFSDFWPLTRMFDLFREVQNR
jgi:hypothetical protein